VSFALPPARISAQTRAEPAAMPRPAAAMLPSLQPASSLAVRCRRGWLGLLLLAALSAPAAAADESLGRLFFSPERRQALDRQRQLHQQDKLQTSEDATLTVNGIVTRSSGRRTAWINGVAQNENDTDSGLSVTPRPRDPASVVVRPGEAPAANARVGETINRNTGETRSLLEDGSIVVHRRGGNERH